MLPLLEHITENTRDIVVKGAREHNLKNVDCVIERGKITVVTGVSGSGKSSLAFDTILAESQRRFFHTLSQYSRQFLDIASRPVVKSIAGLSPAIALAQRETMPSRKASVGTLTDISELLGVAYANFATKLCPRHLEPTSSRSAQEICDRIIQDSQGKTVALCVSVAHDKKGVFRAQLTRFRDKQFTRAYVDGAVRSIEVIPDLAREEKHFVKVIIDQIKIKDTSGERLRRSVETCLQEGENFGEYYTVQSDGNFSIKDRQVFSTQSGCPVCGFSWPKLDTRYFSANSLGKCTVCEGYGSVIQEIEAEDPSDDEEYWQEEACTDCRGTGIEKDVRAIKLGDFAIQDLLLMPLLDLRSFLTSYPSTSPAYLRVRDEVVSKINAMDQIGIGYLNLARRVRSLSGGEQQRLKLAGILAENLRGVMYVLDEPSQGLHPKEIHLLWENLRKLRDDGNTIIVVDHDEELMRRADWIVDLGPGGGAEGGNILARFRPKDAKAFQSISKTAAALTHISEGKRIAKKTTTKYSEWIEIKKPRLNNLKMNEAKFPVGALSVVTGVSGAGKSSLVLRTLYEGVMDYFTQGAKKVSFANCELISGLDAFETVTLIDRRPVAKSSVSMPATYLDALSEFRELYSSLPEAKVAGLNAKSFSLHSEGGRCPECKGRGQINLQMRFLADARIRCPVCHGKRFRPHILEMRYNGLNMFEVLDLTIDQALEHFKNHRKIVERLRPASEIGLGYLKMGQPSSSLSGGESQRLKLVPFFQKKFSNKHLVIIDEPTVGLHFTDVEKLVAVLNKLNDQGATIVVIDNNSDILSIADYHLHLGPGSAADGGKVVYEGAPALKWLDA